MPALRLNFRRLTIFGALLASWIVLAHSSLTEASAATFTEIYPFCSVQDCFDGIRPQSDLLRDAAGNLYGTTYDRGEHLGGVVFELSNIGGSWKGQVLYSFCLDGSCPGGNRPISPLIVDTAGNLYGSTSAIGDAFTGAVFELIPYAGRTKWRLKILHQFCQGAGCKDGTEPNGLTYAGALSGLPYDGMSPLYGTTSDLAGGASKGTVFELLPPLPGEKKWTANIIYRFCKNQICPNGAQPNAVVMDGTGNLFGTTATTVFEMTPKRKGWSVTLLHHFNGGQDGAAPRAPVTIDAAGNLYGTTFEGGSNDGGGECPLGCGTIFKLTRSGDQYVYSKLYDFCSQAACTDGANPWSRVTLDDSGNLYGTTFLGGNDYEGVIYALNPGFHVLHSFCAFQCYDGAEPIAGMLWDGSGHLFGTTALAGSHRGGNVFEFTP